MTLNEDLYGKIGDSSVHRFRSSSRFWLLEKERNDYIQISERLELYVFKLKNHNRHETLPPNTSHF